MSGLAGIYRRDGAAVDARSLGRMADTLAHRGLADSWVWRDGAVGIAYRALSPSPTSDFLQAYPSAPHVTIAFDGRLDNREELRALLADEGALPPESSDAACVAAAYRAFGTEFPARLVGDFALVLFDRRARTLLLARDPLGIRPLYYLAVKGALLFATEIKALLAGAPDAARPDRESLARAMIGTGAAADGETCFADIKSVPPGQAAIETPDSFALRVFWDFDPAHRVHCSSLGDYAEGFRFYFEQAVARRLASTRPVAVAVSGGLDSSSILAVAHGLHQGRPGSFAPVIGLTYSPADGSPADEQAFLKALEACGPAIAHLPAPPPGSLHAAREVVRLVEMPLLDPLWNATHSVHAAAAARGTGTLLTGHWGDQVVGSPAYLIDLFRRFRWTTLLGHLLQRVQWSVDVPPSRHLHAFFADVLRAHVPDCLVSLLRHVVPTPGWQDLPRSLQRRLLLDGRNDGRRCRSGEFESLHARSLYQELRSASTVRCLEWNNKIGAAYGLDVSFPFLDRDFLAFVLGIPGDILNTGGTPKGLLRTALRSSLPPCIAQRRSKGNYSHIVNAGASRDLPQARTWLTQRARSPELGLLAPEALRSCLSGGPDRTSDNCLAAWRIQRLAAVELWLDVFCPDTSSAKETTSVSLGEMVPSS
ncbi:asparagine synthetase B family protein [Nitrospira moscoviensis]|uniref:asparagine synthase (glutamine-hydrolyzing) n=1 Tax=Nitrospira moscoviensis TaxID=42253 RepID=A0A0K2GD31_NITMO|nr:asparagine synthetase B [Nitrospira moscoviensis]ALA58866.1 putative Asparagine synthase (glutamine-hydrolyzing) [Nitrospira moscoviensis]